jgi:hypothetical protein
VQEVFLFSKAFAPAVGPMQPFVQLVAAILSPGVRWPGREANHSPPYIAEVNMQ